MDQTPAHPRELEPHSTAKIGLRRIARGAVWNWTQLVVTGAIGFFLSPFVVNHLGATTYGVWALVSSVVAYMVLLDLGIRGAVVRFVSADHSRGLHADASSIVSAALWFRLWLAVVVLLGGLTLSLAATALFHLPPALHAPARIAILLSTATVALSLTAGVFSGVLHALLRFDLIAIAGVALSALTAAGFVVLLRGGHGIVAMACWQLVVGSLNAVFLYRSTARVYPQLRILLRPPGRALVRQFGGYSLFLFISAVASQVIYYSDNVVIGAALPISAVTLYALGFAPTQYLRQIISSLAVTFLPAASDLAAHNDYEQLRRLLIQGTRVMMAVALPIEVALFIRGKTFISLWMGPQYRDVSGHVLQVLVISWFFIAGDSCAGNIVYGLAKHKAFAIGTIAEAIANLSLSIFLVRRMGVVGVAWGTTLAGFILNALIWPRYIARLLHIPLHQYLLQSWLRPAVAIIPYAVACVLAERFWSPGHLATFFLQMVCLLPLALGGFMLVFRREMQRLLRTRPRFLVLRRAPDKP